MEPVSPPPRLICCFSFMPAKDERRKRRGKGVSRSDLESRSWGKNEDMLSDVSTFSVQEQERRLKIAREEEDRARREAEKVDMWVRQESARMKVSIPEEKDAKERSYGTARRRELCSAYHNIVSSLYIDCSQSMLLLRAKTKGVLSRLPGNALPSLRAEAH